MPFDFEHIKTKTSHTIQQNAVYNLIERNTPGLVSVIDVEVKDSFTINGKEAFYVCILLVICKHNQFINMIVYLPSDQVCE